MWMFLMPALAGSYAVVEGPRPLKDLVAGIKARRADFEKCFTGPDTVKMRVVVGADGLVSDAKFSMTDVNQEVATCVTRGTMKLRLAPSTDPGPTTYSWMATKASLDEDLRGDRPPLGDLFVTGGLTKEQVHAKMKLNQLHFGFCMRQAAVADKSLTRASLDLHFGVDASGTIVSAESHFSDAGEAFGTCVANRAMGLKFDKPQGDGLTQVVYPLEFVK